MPHPTRQEVLRYDADPGPVNNIEKVRGFVDWLTDDVCPIFQVVQGVLIHDGWVNSYGVHSCEGDPCPKPLRIRHLLRCLREAGRAWGG